MEVTSTGAERLVAPADLFFSTTDRKGVIDGSNTVFTRYAQYAMHELLGAPHNIIRHPDMPAGVFRIMWDLLLSGYPMAGYVNNLAHDGVSYWVFATITPLGDGFLSVRQTPCRTDLFDAATSLYTQVLPLEDAVRAAGYSRAEAATYGVDALAKGIGGLGLADYKDFIRLAVPAEVSARHELTSWTGPDPRDPGRGVLRDLIDAAIAVDRALDDRMAGLDELEVLSTHLAETARKTTESLAHLEAAVAAAAAASQQVGDTEPVLGRIVAPLSEISRWMHEAIGYVGHRIDDARDQIAELRLRTALARLHDEMLAEFAREMAAGEAPERAPVYVQQLCRALEEATTTATREARLTNEGLRLLGEDLVAVEGEMHTFQRQLATWRLLIPRYRLSQRLDPFTAPIDRQLLSGMQLIGTVRELASRCLSSSRPFDSGPLSAAVDDVIRARVGVEQELS